MPNPPPHPPLIQEITAALVAVPFVPFAIITRDNARFDVTTRHHAHVTPAGDVALWCGREDELIEHISGSDVACLDGMPPVA